MNAPSQSLAHVKELEDRYVMSTFARNNVEFVQGSGMKLTDSTGKTYLDFLAGIAVCSLGHNHPVLTKTLQEQAGGAAMDNKIVHGRIFGQLLLFFFPILFGNFFKQL